MILLPGSDSAFAVCCCNMTQQNYHTIVYITLMRKRRDHAAFQHHDFTNLFTLDPKEAFYDSSNIWEHANKDMWHYIGNSFPSPYLQHFPFWPVLHTY
jgi:uncharacterized protein YchJ